MAKSLLSGMAALALVGLPSAACSQTPPITDGLSWKPDPYADFALMPTVEGRGSQPLNEILGKLDEAAQAQRRDCLTGESPHVEYSRTVWAPFKGPRLISIGVNEGYYCGGAHPSVDLRIMTFDRVTGGVPDWDVLWSGSRLEASLQGSGYISSTTRAPALLGWFREAVRADASNDPEWLEQCDAYYGSDPVEEPIMIWLDGASGSIVMDLADLPHAAMACGSPQSMSAEQAAALGASAELVDILHAGAAGHKPEDLPQ